MKDLVTELRQERGGFRVTVNDAVVFRLSSSDFQALPLADGQALDWEQYRRDLLLRQYPEALQRAVASLAAKMCSRAELERSLVRKGFLPDTVEMVLYKLEKESLLDDSAFARAYARARAAKGLGRMRILQDLRLKGVDGAVAETAVAELDQDDQSDAAVALAAKLLKRHAGEPAPDAIRKSVAAMLRRGYRYAEASRALQAALERIKDE
jgi:regulatory protein